SLRARGRVSRNPTTEATTNRPTTRMPSQSVGIRYSQRKFIVESSRKGILAQLHETAYRPEEGELERVLGRGLRAERGVHGPADGGAILRPPNRQDRALKAVGSAGGRVARGAVGGTDGDRANPSRRTADGWEECLGALEGAQGLSGQTEPSELLLHRSLSLSLRPEARSVGYGSVYEEECISESWPNPVRPGSACGRRIEPVRIRRDVPLPPRRRSAMNQITKRRIEPDEGELQRVLGRGLRAERRLSGLDAPPLPGGSRRRVGASLPAGSAPQITERRNIGKTGNPDFEENGVSLDDGRTLPFRFSRPGWGAGTPCRRGAIDSFSRRPISRTTSRAVI